MNLSDSFEEPNQQRVLIGSISQKISQRERRQIFSQQTQNHSGVKRQSIISISCQEKTFQKDDKGQNDEDSKLSKISQVKQIIPSTVLQNRKLKDNQITEQIHSYYLQTKSPAMLKELTKDNKYDTVDPLILETLNLNRQRINHIINIIHGSDHELSSKTQRINKTSHKHKTIASLDHQSTVLPNIYPTARKYETSLKQTTHKQKAKISFTESNHQTSLHHSTNDIQAEKQKTITNRYQRSPRGHKLTRQERAVEQEVLDLQQQYHLSLHDNKKLQMMKDYMTSKLKRSQSHQINPKDIYRFEIERMVGELTPIDKLQQSEDRMRRLKKKHRHLINFDQHYYSTLNQHDLLILFSCLQQSNQKINLTPSRNIMIDLP